MAHLNKCISCKKPILVFDGQREQETCSECLNMYKQGEVEHSRLIRCPNCHFFISMYDLEDIFTDGTHSVVCEKCDHDFEITTHVEFTFTSPGLD